MNTNLVRLLFIALVLSACNPCKRIAKQISKHPECVERFSDTVTLRDTIPADTIILNIPIEIDTSGLIDSLKTYLHANTDTLTLIKYITSKVQIKPLEVNQDSLTAKIWIENGQIKAVFDVKPTVIESKVEVQKLVYKNRKNIWWVFLLFGILSGSYLSMLFLRK